MMITQTSRHHIDWDSALDEALFWEGSGEPISEAAARTIAGAFASPRNVAITNLAQGSTYSREDALDEVRREMAYIAKNGEVDLGDLMTLSALVYRLEEFPQD